MGFNFLALHPKAPVILGLSNKEATKYADGHLDDVENNFGWTVKGTHSKLKVERVKVVVPTVGKELGVVMLIKSEGLSPKMQGVWTRLDRDPP